MDINNSTAYTISIIFSNKKAICLIKEVKNGKYFDRKSLFF